MHRLVACQEGDTELVRSIQHFNKYCEMLNIVLTLNQDTLKYRIFKVSMHIHTNKSYVWEDKDFRTVQI